MSTYGTVLIADVPDVSSAEALAQAATRVFATTAPQAAVHVQIVDRGDDGRRVCINAPTAVVDRREARIFSAAGSGRAVLCEDGDEYGVVFQIWRLSDLGGRCVYRTYVPFPGAASEPGTAGRTVTGAAAASEAAGLYDVSRTRFTELEADPTPVTEAAGFVGLPFMPWLEHLGLEWPQPRDE